MQTVEKCPIDNAPQGLVFQHAHLHRPSLSLNFADYGWNTCFILFWLLRRLKLVTLLTLDRWHTLPDTSVSSDRW